MRFNALLEYFVNEKLCVAVSPCIKFSLFSLVSMQSRRLLVGCRWTWHWSYLGPSWHNALAGGHCWGHLPLHHHVRSFCIPFLSRSEFPIYILIIYLKLTTNRCECRLVSRDSRLRSQSVTIVEQVQLFFKSYLWDFLFFSGQETQRACGVHHQLQP